MPGQTKKINPGRAFRLFYSEGEKMTFAEAVNKYNCYARDVLGLVGELDIPSRDMSTSISVSNFETNTKNLIWILRDAQDMNIATINADTGKVL
jgi:hypothetical protein